MTRCAQCDAPQPPIWLSLSARFSDLPRCAGCDRVQPVIAWQDAPATWMLVAPPHAAANWAHWERLAERRFWRAVARRPRWLANPEACRRRLVFGLPGLHEKQLIWSADLDDALIECLKLDVRLRVPRLRATPQADLRLRAVDDQSLGFGSSHGAGVRVPRDRYVQLAAEERTLAHRWPALFQRPFVHHGRLRGSWP